MVAHSKEHAMRRLHIWLALIWLVMILVPVCVLASLQDFEISGDLRLRLRFTDSDYTGHLKATYGEEVRRGFSFRHRAIFEVTYPFGEDFRAGALVRISNEPDEVIESGPEYLSSQFGSAFIAYESQSVNARFGYYQVSFTPLALMRWDLNDDPEGGGGVCAVCGGPGVAGAILGETLEELGPELTFEGLKLKVTPNEFFQIEGYFARPSIADETYPVVTFGVKAGLRQYLSHAKSFIDIAVIALRSQDDHKTLKGSTEPLGRVFENNVYGLTWEIPIIKEVAFEGEWILTSSQGRDLAQRSVPGWDMRGRGGRIVLSFKPEKRWLLDAAYIYLSPNWDSYFRGLSYQPNRRGLRLRCEYGGERLVVALFGKFLSTIDDVFFGQQPKSRVIYPTLSARAYYEIHRGVNLGIATIFSGEGTSNNLLTTSVGNKRTTLLGTVTVELSKDLSISLEERYVFRRSDLEPDYDVSLTSLYVRTVLW